MRRIVFLLFLTASSLAWAQSLKPPDFVTPRERYKFTEDKEFIGWKPAATVEALYSVSSSNGVIGQTDGVTQVYGLNLKSSFTYIEDLKEWRNTFNYTGATSKTPTIPRYIKSSDELKLETIYLRALPSYPTVGPYVKANMTAPVFRGEDARNQPTTYSITSGDGTLRDNQTETTLPLTDGFRPMTTQESVGFFWKPQNDEKMTLELRAGLGAMQVQAKDQLSVQDNPATPQIEVVELKSFSQTGIETGVLFKGKLDEKTNYEINAETLTPIIKDAGENRDSFRLTNFNFGGKISSQITKWMAVSYEYKIKTQPQLVERAQIQTMLAININYTLL